MSNPNYIVDASSIDKAIRVAGLDPQDKQDVQKFMVALKDLMPAAVGIAASEARTGKTSGADDLSAVWERYKAQDEANAPAKPLAKSTGR